MILVPPEASLSPDGQTVTLRRGAWMETFNVAALPFRLAFYRKLARVEAADPPKGKGGKAKRAAADAPSGRQYDFQEIYGPTVKALEALTKG